MTMPSAFTLGNAISWQPSDNGLLAANFDPMAAQSPIAVTAGTVYLLRFNIRATVTFTNILLGLTTTGAGASTGSFVGVYSSAGILLSGSADQAAQFTAAAPATIVCPLSTPQVIAGGSFVWVAVLSNLAVTQPSIARSPANPAAVNGGLAAAGLRSCVNGTGLTALPAPITPASNTPTNSQPLWIGVT